MITSMVSTATAAIRWFSLGKNYKHNIMYNNYLILIMISILGSSLVSCTHTRIELICNTSYISHVMLGDNESIEPSADGMGEKT